MVSFGYCAGFKAIKRQIIPSMRAHKVDLVHLEKYTHDLLQRTCPGWMHS